MRSRQAGRAARADLSGEEVRGRRTPAAANCPILICSSDEQYLYGIIYMTKVLGRTLHLNNLSA